MSASQKPLAERMRPTTLNQYIGQSHLIGEQGILRQMVVNQIQQSIIFWGPPGVGKTTLAQIIANTWELPFYTLSAIESGVKEVRTVIDLSRRSGKSLLFIDEIHRFNKSQQDSLLGAIEKGWIVLIGATTENPSFEVNRALLSRCQVYVLEPFSVDELKQIVDQALQNDVILKTKNIEIAEWDALLRFSGGDGRKILNLLEFAVGTTSENQLSITNALITKVAQQASAAYDKSGEQHYDIISAFIKSIRGSDPNAALYYLARMIQGGEDPKFIARRLIILASEDIGNANPNALLLATSTFQAVQFIGYPECRIILAQAVTYLASSSKSNASYEAINTAQQLVRQTGDLPVPLHLRNAPTKLMKELNYGDEYKYAHSYPNNFVVQEFLPESLSGTALYTPGNTQAEKKLKEYLKFCWGEKYNY